MNSEYTIQKEMQACQLRILVDFQKVCAKNNICFYLAFGTCLGAVRHKGFIPWDDDIDLFMRVDEVEKLKEVQDQLPPHLYLQTHEKDPEFGLPIVRIRDSSTTLIEADLCDRDINHGVYIDIYPLFYCNGKENAILVKLAAIESLICRLFTYNAPPSNKSSISTSVSKLLLRLVPDSLKRKIANYLYKDLISHKKTKYVSNFPVPLDSNTENEIGKYYTSSYYNCCKTEFKRHDLNFRFEIDDPYYKYGMKTDYYGGEIFHLCVTDWYNEPILDKYYKSYSTEEISKEEFDEIEKNSDWHYTGHWTGNFVPDDEYKNYKKFEIVEVFSLCTRMFFSYDEDRNLDKVRIYEGTPYHSSEIKIVGLEK